MRSRYQAKDTRSRAVFSKLSALGMTMTFFLSVGACGQKAPTTPDVPWFPDHHLLDRQTTVVAVHEASIESGHVYSLGELIDIAESNSPTTQAA
jgi:outer membrane protein